MAWKRLLVLKNANWMNLSRTLWNFWRAWSVSDVRGNQIVLSDSLMTTSNCQPVCKRYSVEVLMMKVRYMFTIFVNLRFSFFLEILWLLEIYSGNFGTSFAALFKFVTMTSKIFELITDWTCFGVTDTRLRNSSLPS